LPHYDFISRLLLKVKEKEVVNVYRFLIVIEKANGNYSAYSPDLPGCVATDKTGKQAQQNMYKAIELHIQG